MKPACVRCGLKLKCHRIGQPVVETSDAGKENDCRLWMTDIHKCPGCGVEIILLFGAQPIAEHYQDDYTETLKRFEPALRVF